MNTNLAYKIPAGLFSTTDFLRHNKIRERDELTYQQARRWLRGKGMNEIVKKKATYWQKP